MSWHLFTRLLPAGSLCSSSLEPVTLKAETHDATNCCDMSRRFVASCTSAVTRLLVLILSLRYAARIQTSLNSCEPGSSPGSASYVQISWKTWWGGNIDKTGEITYLHQETSISSSFSCFNHWCGALVTANKLRKLRRKRWQESRIRVFPSFSSVFFFSGLRFRAGLRSLVFGLRFRES